jgi:hypothetical protein
MKRLYTMRQALADKALVADAMPGETWKAWRVLLIAAVGERLTKAERLIFKRFTGRDAEPGAMVDTFLAVSGRRSGKTTAMAALVVYLACLCDWSVPEPRRARPRALPRAGDDAGRARVPVRAGVHPAQPADE